MDNIQITHNNDNHHYRIAMDIAKEGSSLWDLTPYVKGRVGDNRFGLQVTWTYQGQLMNVEGMKPYIEGNVGQYSVDDQNNLQLDPNSGVVRYVGDPADCQAGGQATYYFPEQMFPKDGIFKGYIGLLDDRDDSQNPHISGVTVWFKVLPGIAEMGHACDYYVSDLEKAEEIFKAKLRQHEADFQNETNKVISDARNSYTTEVSNAHDALLALVSQIQANRDEQANLTNRLAGTEQQIETHDVVTRPEFLNLSNQLTQQVSQMKEAGLEFFNNADDLKAKYPNGANKLCVTLDDSHEWVYDYANGQWNDAGAFNYGTIDPKLTSAIFQPNPDNLIKNSQFITTNYWNLGRDKTDPDCYVESTSQGNAMVINGYVADGSSNESWIVTDPIEVSDSKYISVGAEIALSGIDYSNGKSAMIGFDFTDKEGKHSYDYRYIPAYYQDGKYHSISKIHITYPPETQNVAISFALWGYGTMKIRRPQASFSNALSPYSSSDLKTKLALTDGNLLIGQPAKDWDFTFFGQKYTVDNDNVITFDCSSAGDTDSCWISSDYIAVNSSDQLIANVEAQINSTDSQAYLRICQYTDIDAQIPNSNIDGAFINTNELTDFVFDNIKLQPSTKFIQVRIYTYGKAILKIGKISLKKKSLLDIACDRSLRSKNLVYDFSYKNWRSFNNPSKIIASENDGTVEITSTAPDYQGLTSSNIAVDATKPLNISFNAKSNRSYVNWTTLEIDQIDSNNEIINGRNISLYITNTSELQKYNFNNIRLYPETKYIKLRIVIYGQGSIWINNLKCDNRKKAEDQNNLFDDIPLSEWSCYNQYGQYDEGSNTWTISTRNLTGQWNMAGSNLIAVKPGSIIKTEVEAKVGILPDNQGRSFIEIQQFQNLWDSVNNNTNIDNFITEPTDNKFKTLAFINKLNSDTNYIKINMVVQNNGDFQLRSIKGSCVDEIPNDLPKLLIDAATNITDKWQSAPFKFNDDGRLVEGYVQYAMQGDSSRHYPKKNLKVKFFADADCTQKLKWKPKSDWDSNNKFNIKANWIDATQSRNLVNSELVKQAISVTPINDANVANKLLLTQNLGEMEGFPIELSFADGYYGLMTFNIKKDDKPYGIDSNDPKQEAITNQTSTDNLNNPNALIDGSDFATVVHDKASAELQTNFTKFLTFINTASDDDFKKNINNYIDLYSVINLYLFGVWSCEWDYYNKSEILLTYNAGKSYYMLPYDLDSTWRLFWDGSKLTGNDVADFATANKNWIEGFGNTLIRRIYQLFKPEIKAQWQKLRSSVWTNANAVNAFKKFINSIPETAYEKEQSNWPDIPSKSITSFEQIQQAIIERGNAMDSFMEHLTDSQPTSPAPQPTTPQAQPTEPKQ